MHGLGLIVALLCGTIFADTIQESELPAWTRAPRDGNTFVVETAEYPTRYEATTSLMPAVKNAVASWVAELLGEDSRPIVESMPESEFRNLIYENQEIIHKFDIDYDPETAKRLQTDHDEYFSGYIRVNVNDEFLGKIESQLRTLRLKKRLLATLIAAIFLLGLLGIAWGYNMSNHRSRGFYISRLRWIAGALIGLLIVICYLIGGLLF